MNIEEIEKDDEYLLKKYSNDIWTALTIRQYIWFKMTGQKIKDGNEDPRVYRENNYIRI